ATAKVPGRFAYRPEHELACIANGWHLFCGWIKEPSMKCAVHAEVEATGYCRNCGKAMCPACTREVKGALYCEECLAGLVAAPAKTGMGNPGAALVLGVIPGLGAVYNGEYTKALVHLVIWGGLFALGMSS